MRLLSFILISTVLHALLVLGPASVQSPVPALSISNKPQSLQLSLQVATSRAAPVPQQPVKEQPTPVPEPVTTPRPAPAAKKKVDRSKAKAERVAATPAAPAREYTSNRKAARMVDPAEYANNPPPQYPVIARRRKYEGTVLLSVQINAAGKATAVRIKESSGHAVLDDEAKRVVAGWRFVPAAENGKTISSQVIVPIRFSLQK